MTKKEVPISVILPTFEIDKCGPALKHLFKQDYSNFEIVIINDNPKSKPSEELLKFIKEKKIRLITNEKNFGIAKSLNRGIRATKHEIIIILCTDYFPESRTWFKHSVDKLYSDKKIGEVCAAAENDDRFWKKYPFLLKLFSFRLMLKRSSGIGVSYKKEVFRNVGLFDTKTFKFAGDDGDLQYRMRKKGYTIEYIDDTILHCHCGENDKLSKILKKEYHYGMGHGARKRKYGIFKRIGLFDFEFRHQHYQ